VVVYTAVISVYYQGCYVEQAKNPDMVTVDASRPEMTVELCTMLCWNRLYKYAGVQVGPR
jgi:hypothetical protein